MFIDPIRFGAIGTDNLRTAAAENGNPSAGNFGDVIKNTWDNAVETDQDLAHQQYLMSIGEINDTHTLPIAQAKAEMAVSLLVNLRNKALESYNELMRLSV